MIQSSLVIMYLLIIDLDQRKVIKADIDHEIIIEIYNPSVSKPGWVKQILVAKITKTNVFIIALTKLIFKISLKLPKIGNKWSYEEVIDSIKIGIQSPIDNIQLKSIWWWSIEPWSVSKNKLLEKQIVNKKVVIA